MGAEKDRGMTESQRLDVALDKCRSRVESAMSILQEEIGEGFEIDIRTTFIDLSTLDGRKVWPRVKVTITRESI